MTDRRSGSRPGPRSRAATTALWAAAGTVPGVVLVLLSVPVSGEAELSLGAGGFFVAVLGLAVGAIAGERRSRR